MTVDVAEELELGLGATIGLALVEDFLRHLLLQDLWRLRLEEILVLAHTQDALEEELGHGEADDQLLPREQRSVQEPCEALFAIEC